MLSRQLIRSGQSCTAARWFSRSNITRKSNQTPKSNENKNEVLGAHMQRVTKFDRWLLAWVKRYPSAAEVPDKVTRDCVLNSRSKARIKGTNYIMLAAALGSIGAVLLGKRDAARGETLFKKRQDWYEGIMKEKDKDNNK